MNRATRSTLRRAPRSLTHALCLFGQAVNRNVRSDGHGYRFSRTRRRVHRQQGSETPFQASSAGDEVGNAYAVVTTERDVTEQLRQESELRFRAMADSIPTLLRIDDATGQARFLNRTWLAFTSESAAEALLADGWFRYIHPDDLPGT